MNRKDGDNLLLLHPDLRNICSVPKSWTSVYNCESTHYINGNAGVTLLERVILCFMGHAHDWPSKPAPPSAALWVMVTTTFTSSIN